MIESQSEEFEEFTPLHLGAFADIHSLPIPRKKREVLIKVVGREVVGRLEKRKKIADPIKRAKKEGVYEIEEHKTGTIEL